MSITIALAGNPNCGKTTLFNALTGSHQYVGNWPGVTVEKKEGSLKSDRSVTITDLPGIYSLSPYTLEEVVARNYLLNEHPDVILNIVDGTNLERNLYLTTQLLELGIPVVIAVNMMDILQKNGDQLNIKQLSKDLGCEIVEISALKGTGIETAASKAVSIAKTQKSPNLLHRFDPTVEESLRQIEIQLDRSEIHIDPKRKRFFTIKLFERDPKLRELLPITPDVESIIQTVEEDFDDDAESIITNERYLYISEIISHSYQKKQQGTLSLSDKIDRIVTNRILALPIFAAVMTLVYYISVTTVGTWLTDWANDGVFGEGWSLFGLWIPGIPVMVEEALTALQTADWLNSLILDGIIGGVGAVLGFVPQILVLFIFLGFLEGCGYMARVAFIMDRIFRRFGLSGKSFIPMLIGSGCGVPGIMASRTIENERDRRMTIMTTTFIPCSAKMPIIGLFAGAIFGGAWWVAPSAYFIGIAAIVISGVILKKTKMFAGDPAPFVIELPAYHLPTAGSVLRNMWERGWSFIKKAGTIILLSTILIWFLSNFSLSSGTLAMTESMDDSLLAAIGSMFAWIFIPTGFGDWQSTVATITGLIAKENVVSTFGILFQVGEEASESDPGLWAAVSAHYSALSAYALMIFNLLCAPCFAAMGAIKREMNNRKWFAFAILYQCAFAYVAALCFYQFGMLLTSGSFTWWTAVAVVLAIGVIYLMARPFKKEGTLSMNPAA